MPVQVDPQVDPVPVQVDPSTVPVQVDPLPMREQDYLTLVDLTGRLVVRGKRGRINPSLAPILDRLGLSPAQWVAASTGFRQHYRNGNLRLNQTA